MKKICILCGSPNKKGNTNQLVNVFANTAENLECEIKTYHLYDMNLNPCKSCRCCQKDITIFGCPQNDDMQEIFDAIMWCDVIVLATPIYSWYCTPPMKAALDRMVYGMNKYYGETKGPSLWMDKEVAIITTCGYRIEQGADLFEEGIKRFCKHSRLKYCGMLAERHLGYGTEFMDNTKEENAFNFAKKIAEAE